MRFFHILENGLQNLFNAFYSIWPRPSADKDRLKNAKIIAHRGEHDNQTVLENTLAAFDRARAAGVWGFECDLRWTRDLQPVIVHDPDLMRVFGINAAVGELDLDELKSACPLVPTLEEVIRRFGKELHVMLEIKEEAYPDPVHQNKVLADALGALRPREDFHIITLNPDMFRVMTSLPPSTFIPVARWNFARLSRLARQENYGGLAGHYRLLTTGTVKTHHDLHQRVGTGYIDSKNCLFRELNRGVDWIFSNCAAALQRTVDQLTVPPE
jgi:glycerophosphoryl diester phosphodiesterase